VQKTHLAKSTERNKKTTSKNEKKKTTHQTKQNRLQQDKTKLFPAPPTPQRVKSLANCR
jgi:murein DD-endopeptidase